MIRQASKNDVKEVVEMWYAMNKEIIKDKQILFENTNIEAMFLTVVKRLTLDNHRIFVYEKEGEVVGFIMGHISWPPYCDAYKVAFCEALYVKPSHRGSSIWQALVKACEDVGKEYNVLGIEMSARYGERVNILYKRMGYSPIATTYRKKVTYG